MTCYLDGDMWIDRRCHVRFFCRCVRLFCGYTRLFGWCSLDGPQVSLLSNTALHGYTGLFFEKFGALSCYVGLFCGFYRALVRNHSVPVRINWARLRVHWAPQFCLPIMSHTATHCNTLQHTATPCNTLQHTAKHMNERHLQSQQMRQKARNRMQHCSTLQHPTIHCNTQ